MLFFVDLNIRKYILILFIGLPFWNCASTNDDAIRRQEDFIKNHPTWKGHDFEFEKRKPEPNALDLIEKINNEKKINAKLDSITLNLSQD